MIQKVLFVVFECDKTVTCAVNFDLSMIIASLACLTPSLFIFVAVCLFVFWYFDVTAFCKRFEYTLSQYIFDVLSAAVNVWYYDWLYVFEIFSKHSLQFIIYFLESKIFNFFFFNLQMALILLVATGIWCCLTQMSI